MEKILSEYLLNQTNLKDIVPSAQVRNRDLYNAFVDADTEIQAQVEESIHEFLRALDESETAVVQSESTARKASLINDYDLPQAAIDSDQLAQYEQIVIEELNRRIASYEAEANRELDKIDKLTDSLNDIHHSEPVIDSIQDATEDLDDLRQALSAGRSGSS